MDTNSNWFIECTPVYNAFGKDMLNNLPILDIGDKRGWTGYIDFIKAEDMEYPIMIGQDCHYRPFIAIKYKSNDVFMVGTFFQRYTDDSKSWAFGTCYLCHGIYHDSRIRLDDYALLEQRLKKLLSGEELRELTYMDRNLEGTGQSMISIIFNK